jgi:electron transfer flavoprotein beta subunit
VTVRIAVCVSQVLDPDKVAELALAGLLRVEAANGTPSDAPHVARVMNDADRQALSKAVKTGAEVVAVNVGASRAGELCTEALQMGAAAAVHVDCDVTRADVSTVAHLLHAAIARAGGADLVLTGLQTSGGDGGATGAALAALLDAPCVVGVRDVRVSDDATVRVTQVHAGGERDLDVTLPAVLSVYDDVWKPPVLNPRHLIAARDRSPLVLRASDLGVDDAQMDALRVVDTLAVEVPALPNRCELLGDGDAGAAVDALLDRLRAEAVL